LSARTLSIAAIVASVTVLAWVSWQRSQRPQQSAEIVEQWADLDGEAWLLPNLSNTTVAQPDRPHSFQEVHAWRKGEYSGLNRVRSYELRTNSDRMRGPKLKPKANGVLRIIALGDSVTHGWGVSEEESFPHVLGERLRSRGVSVEVLNAGVPSNTDVAMQRWCTRKAVEMDPDLIIWTRRVHQRGPNPHATYNRAVQACKKATGAPIIVALPPVSTFDLKGSEQWSAEYARMKTDLGDVASAVIELTPIFRAAQAGRGVVLETRGLKLAVVDQTHGIPIIEVPPISRDLPAEIYALFERDSTVREALFFDDGHPDAEGFKVFAEALVEPVMAALSR
jgi:hypothetical protein